MKKETKESFENAKKALSELGDNIKGEIIEISAKLVKQLRDKTDAGIMECKNALKECRGNIDEAIEYLRQKGLSKAAKKADRIAAEGVIALKLSDDYSKATIVEVNSETDFVAKNEAFQELVENVLDLSFKRALNSTECITELTLNGESFGDYLKQKIAIIGENIIIRRTNTLVSKGNQVLGAYLHHNKKIGSIALLEFDNSANKDKVAELASLISMHIASMKPKYLSYKDLDSEFIAKEKIAIAAELEKENEDLARLDKPLHKIPVFVSRLELTESVLENKKNELKENLKKEGKPDNIIDKIVAGQIERFISDNTILDQRMTLLSQNYALDDKKTVEQVINEESKKLKDNIRVKTFVSFELGEGIEKKVDNFAEEVAAQMK